MNRTRSAGFVITLEFLLVMALFVVPLIIGMIMVGRKLFTLYLNKRDFIEQPYSRAVVWDSSAPPKAIGPVMGYDQFEAPLVIFRDAATTGGVVLGVRPDRFTSVGAVYYDTVGCSGSGIYVRSPLSSTTIGSGGILYYPPNGVAYQMGGISYAMGAGNVLYRSNGTVASPVILSVWMSQDTTSGPCYSGAGVLGTLPTDLVPAAAVIDLDSGPPNYTLPFRLAFPTPGTPTDPALPCPTAECGP